MLCHKAPMADGRAVMGEAAKCTLASATPRAEFCMPTSKHRHLHLGRSILKTLPAAKPRVIPKAFCSATTRNAVMPAVKIWLRVAATTAATITTTAPTDTIGSTAATRSTLAPKILCTITPAAIGTRIT